MHPLKVEILKFYDFYSTLTPLDSKPYTGAAIIKVQNLFTILFIWSLLIKQIKCTRFDGTSKLWHHFAQDRVVWPLDYYYIT